MEFDTKAENHQNGPLWCLDSPMGPNRKAWAHIFHSSVAQKLYFNHQGI